MTGAVPFTRRSSAVETAETDPVPIHLRGVGSGLSLGTPVTVSVPPS